ncbi:hypothetical protein ROA7745_04124 [Roseovarius aestuarii]|uniref:Uncharacterized protein n=1 Tax=Roseovarius aestuarii TaxID=475083 RepID=A0A1X7BXD4_9RHOB|nr:hypothetical protein ROA7745_04124 [Roseovarius aestuarii]
MAIEIGKMSTNAVQVDEPINRPQQMFLRDVILQRERVEQRCLRFLPRSQHRSISHLNVEIESATCPSIKEEFFNEISQNSQFL